LGLLFCLFLWLFKPLLGTGIIVGWSFVWICVTLSVLSALLFGAADVLAENWTSDDGNRVLGVSWVVVTVLYAVLLKCPLAPLAVTVPFVPIFVGAILGSLIGDGLRERRLKRSRTVHPGA
jgi:hypothetical protein